MSEQATAQVAAQYGTFREFVAAEYETEELQDIAGHGADAGWPHITYTRDAVALYDAYECELWDMLNEGAEMMGAKNVQEFVSGFVRSDMADTPDGFKNLVVWYAIEELARENA
jgi:hypothetical protein